jgi:hypothetical protein
MADVFGVGHRRDPGVQRSAQLLKLVTGVVTGHLLTGDDGHRSGDTV